LWSPPIGPDTEFARCKSHAPWQSCCVRCLEREVDRLTSLISSFDTKNKSDVPRKNFSDRGTEKVSEPRDCTCLGTCKGADGLGPGWRCALESGKAAPAVRRGPDREADDCPRASSSEALPVGGSRSSALGGGQEQGNAAKQLGWMDSEGPVTVPSGRPSVEHNNQASSSSEAGLIDLVTRWRTEAAERDRKCVKRSNANWKPQSVRLLNKCADELATLLAAQEQK